MSMRDIILKIVEEHPKHFSQIIKRNTDLCEFIGYQKESHANIAQLAYDAVHPEQNICDHGNNPKFKSFREGYGFCGKTKVCECARKSVSSKVSSAKQAYTVEQRAQINQQRMATNQKKYGVANTGQIEQAKQRHTETYADPKRVEEINKHIATVKNQRHGNPTYNNPEKISRTWQQIKQQHFEKRFPDKQLSVLNDQEKMAQMYDTKSIDQIAQSLNVHVQTVYRHLADHGIRKKFSSSLEQEMVSFIRHHGITNIVQNTRKVISRELDIYLPDYNMAIEMNGVYWHHDAVDYIDRNYHYTKFKQCEQQGIQLITVFSDIWENRKPIIQKTILGKLGILRDTTVYARNTEIRPVSTCDTRDFLNQYHIQGFTPSTYRYGLYYQAELVAVMTFSKPRAGIGKHRDNTVELVRYATKYCVVGGASKLLKHFVRSYPEYTTIISYSDNEWSMGNLYQTLGFSLEREHKPGYFYYDTREKKRKHRYQFAKHRLVEQGFDPNLTEYQIQQQRGYLRIWDCGKRVWVLQYP